MGTVQSIDRAFLIIELIAKNEGSMTISDISEQSQLHKSTVHRLLTSLIENGYVEQMPDLSYKLSFRMYEMGVSVLKGVDLMDASSQVLNKLADEVNEVVHLVVRSDSHITYIDKKNASTHGSIMGSRIGSVSPIYCTAAGKALLFNTSDEDIEEVWKRSDIKKLTENTITNKKDFKKEIYESKKRGFSMDDQENEVGITCLGAPIYNHLGEVIAAVSISGPSSRLNEENLEKYTHALKNATLVISKNLGYIPAK